MSKSSPSCSSSSKSEDIYQFFANAKDYKEIHKEYGADLQQYILQMRKLFVSCYLIIQKPQQLVSDLRIHIS